MKRVKKLSPIFTPGSQLVNKAMKKEIKNILYFIIKVLFFLSIPGFLFLILNDRSYGGGGVIFVFSVWGLFGYAKWINKTFNFKKQI